MPQRRTFWKSMTIAVLTALALAYLATFALLALNQRALLYPRGGLDLAPVEAGLPAAERLMLTTSDGERLPAWHVAPEAAPGRVVFAYFHGNGGSLANRARLFRAMTARGDGLLAVEYRGYAGASGSPSEQGLLLDAEALLAEAARRGYAQDRIILVGESLGAGVAVALACASPNPFAGVVLDSAYESVLALARAAYPFFPVRLALLDAWRSDLRIAGLRSPLLMAHGEADDVIPIASGKRLFDLAPEPRRFIAVPGQGHVVLDLITQEMFDWLEPLRRK